MDGNKVLADKFLQWFSTKYEHLKNKYYKFCEERDYEWDEDVFSDTYLKVYDKIVKSGINDSSDKGMENYFFIAFKMNLKRSKQYCRHTKRDYNYTDDEITSLYEDYMNEHQDSAMDKVRSDCVKDFFVKEIIESVEREFGTEKAHLFASKYLIKGNTYKELARKTNRKNIRNEILEIKRWVQENISKDLLMGKFREEYDELLEN